MQPGRSLAGIFRLNCCCQHSSPNWPLSSRRDISEEGILDRSIDHPEKWPELIYYIEREIPFLIQINLHKRGDDSGRSLSLGANSLWQKKIYISLNFIVQKCHYRKVLWEIVPSLNCTSLAKLVSHLNGCNAKFFSFSSIVLSQTSNTGHSLQCALWPYYFSIESI